MSTLGDYIWDMSFEERPDYDFVEDCLKDLLKQSGSPDEKDFDWNIPEMCPIANSFHVGAKKEMLLEAQFIPLIKKEEPPAEGGAPRRKTLRDAKKKPET